jgi:hypothetical protein
MLVARAYAIAIVFTAEGGEERFGACYPYGKSVGLLKTGGRSTLGSTFIGFESTILCFEYVHGFLIT